MGRLPITNRFILLLLVALATCSIGKAAPHSDADRPISVEGIIDRVIANGPEPVFRAVGVTFRVGPSARVSLGKGLTALSDVSTNTWVSFEGRRGTSGIVQAEKAHFARVKLPKRKPSSIDVQVTTFPPGSKIDADSGFAAGSSPFPENDHGGWCGWYSVLEDANIQARIRDIGMRLVPKYQRDLPAENAAKIPFRFYAVDGTQIRTAIFCGDGLILIPRVVMDRLSSDNLLAAVLAEGIAGALQLQASNARGFTLADAGPLALGSAGYLGPESAATMGVAGLITGHEVARRMEHDRGRMSLALMADAGFDPYQAPLAWQLLASRHSPKNGEDLKDPELSRFLEETLEWQYKRATPGAVETPP